MKKDYFMKVTFNEGCPYCKGKNVMRIDSEFMIMRCSKCNKMFWKDF